MKNSTIVIVIVLVIVIVGAILIVSYSNYYQTPTATTSVTNNSTTVIPAPTTSATTTQVTPSSASTSAVSAAAVSIKNFAFSPASLTVKVGTTVTWTNNDTVAHTVTSDSGTFLNSPTLAPGQSYSVTFTNAGSMSYHCNIHPMMKGSIIVTS